MKRKEFLSKTLCATLGSAITTTSLMGKVADTNNILKHNKYKILNAYYFRAHMYTMVPRHVREDMKWMADRGTNAITIAVLEQDVDAAVKNVQIICNEASKYGMEVHAVPSRWGGLFAGAPKVPSKFTSINPDTWILNKDGSFAQSTPSGPLSSVHHPATLNFFLKTLEAMLAEMPLKGIIWDEPKILYQSDYSAAAKKVLGADASFEAHADAGANFIDLLGKEIKKMRPEMKLSLFIHASTTGYVRERINRIETLDYVGCDGRPWAKEDTNEPDYNRKCLLGNADSFIANAKRHNKKTVVLVENYNMPAGFLPLYDKNFPKILALNPDQLIYYYYPRNIDDPEKHMAVVSRHIKNFHKK